MNPSIWFIKIVTILLKSFLNNNFNLLLCVFYYYYLLMVERSCLLYVWDKFPGYFHLTRTRLHFFWKGKVVQNNSPICPLITGRYWFMMIVCEKFFFVEVFHLFQSNHITNSYNTKSPTIYNKTPRGKFLVLPEKPLL